jgi:4-hydroxy-2-oxoheptanedioate aldolase
MVNTTKDKLKAGETVIGPLTGIMDEQLIEALGWSGVFDFITIDIEHSPITTETCERLIRAANSAGLTPLFRPLHTQARSLLRFFDAGAQGVQAPLVETVAGIREITDGMLYPPLGQRGLAMVRAARFGQGITAADYVEKANQEMLLVAQLETRRAVENLPDLLDCPNIDVYYIGPVDLSISYGHPGRPDHPEVAAAMERVEKQVLRAGKMLGTIARNAEQAQDLIRRGYRYLAIPLTGFIVQSAKKLVEQARSGG